MFKKYKATELAVVLTNLGSLLGKDTDCAIGLKKSQLCSEFERLAFGLVYIRPCVDIYFKQTSVTWQ